MQVLDSPYSIRRCVKDAIGELPLRVFRLLRLPGFIRAIEYADKVTGDYIRIRVGLRYTVVAVNNREYWFRRVTGAFDGTGYAICNSMSESLDYILGDILESARPLSLWERLKKRLLSTG